MPREHQDLLGTLLSAVCEESWALEHGVLVRMRNVLTDWHAGVEVPTEAVAQIVAMRSAGPGQGVDSERGYRIDGRAAVIPIGGLIAKHTNQVNGSSQPRGTSTQAVRGSFRRANMDPDVAGIMMHVESNGGGVSGVEQLATEIAAQRDDPNAKPVWAFFDDSANSAAAWLGLQAGNVSATKMAVVGSIGVYGMLADTSKYYENRGVKMHLVKAGEFKGIGEDGIKIDDKALANVQSRIDKVYGVFVDAVARGRRMTREQAQGLATGQTWIGKEGMDVGLVDAIHNSAEDALRAFNKALYDGTARMKTRASIVVEADIKATTDKTPDRASVEATTTNAPSPTEGQTQKAAEQAAGDDAMNRHARMLMLAAGTPEGVGGGGGSTVVAEAKAAPEGAKGGGDTSGADAAKADVIANAAVEKERARASEIRNRAKLWAGKPGGDVVAKLADEAIEKGWSSSQFSLKCVDEIPKAHGPTGHTPDGGAGSAFDMSITGDARDKRMSLHTNALIMRMASPYVDKIRYGDPDARRLSVALGFDNETAAVKAFRDVDAAGSSARRLMDIAAQSFIGNAEAIQARVGHSFRVPKTLDQARSMVLDGNPDFMQAAFSVSSDFPLITSTASNKVMAARFMMAPVVWRNFCRKGESGDYKQTPILGISRSARFKKLPEGKEPERIAFNERGENISVEAYALEFAWTFQQMMNDNLGALQAWVEFVADAAAEIPEDIVFDLLNLNAGGGQVMTLDGNNFFHATHNNLGNTPLNYTNVQAAITAMKTQKDFSVDSSGRQQTIVVEPAVMLTHTSQEWTAKDLVGPNAQEFVPGNAGQQNQRNQIRNSMKPVSSHRVGGAAWWYTFADPARYTPIQVNFFQGQETPIITSKSNGNPMNEVQQATLRGCGARMVQPEAAWYSPGA